MNLAIPEPMKAEPAERRQIQGGVAVTLRAEALVELALAVAAYHYVGGGWRLFAALFLVPDLCMAGYLINLKVGAFIYNLGHSYVLPALLALSGLLPYQLALIWAAHIGFDRVLGYGLKYPAGFGATHLTWK